MNVINYVLSKMMLSCILMYNYSDSFLIYTVSSFYQILIFKHLGGFVFVLLLLKAVLTLSSENAWALNPLQSICFQ